MPVTTWHQIYQQDIISQSERRTVDLPVKFQSKLFSKDESNLITKIKTLQVLSMTAEPFHIRRSGAYVYD